MRACVACGDPPDVGADVHLAALQGRVHSQVDGVLRLPAVVLVDEHRVFCDVISCGIPERKGGEMSCPQVSLLFSDNNINDNYFII